MVGIQYDHRVGVRDIQAGLDNRCRDQHIAVPFDKIQHDVFQSVFVHLPMSDADHSVRHQCLDFRRDLLNALDSVKYHKDLPSAPKFTLDDITQQVIVLFQNIGLHRIAFLRRFLNQTHVLDAGQRHIQRPRNRRSRKRQHVDIVFHFFDGFLGFDTEALFLIDDQQPQIFEFNILRKQPVRADYQIDISLLKLGNNLILLRRRSES